MNYLRFVLKRFISMLLGLALVLLLAGILTMILHYPFNTMAFVTFGGVASVLMILRYVFKTNKRPSDLAKYVGLSIYILSRAWTVAHWKFSRELSWAGLILIAVWITWRYIEDEEGWKFVRVYFRSGLLLLGMVICLIAVLFKMLHWMGADILLIAAFSILALWVFTHFVIGAFRSKVDL